MNLVPTLGRSLSCPDTSVTPLVVRPVQRSKSCPESLIASQCSVTVQVDYPCRLLITQASGLGPTTRDEITFAPSAMTFLGKPFSHKGMCAEFFFFLFFFCICRVVGMVLQTVLLHVLSVFACSVLFVVWYRCI